MKTNPVRTISRRDTLKGMLAAGAAPWFVPARVLGAEAPSKRITLGFIGMGSQGTQSNLRNFLAQDDAKGALAELYWGAANRDERRFVEPDPFDLDRRDQTHLGFGHGVHFCLGASLARMEINSFLTELIPRIKSIELNGTPELMATTFVGGLKHLPIRVELK